MEPPSQALVRFWASIIYEPNVWRCSLDIHILLLVRKGYTQHSMKYKHHDHISAKKGANKKFYSHTCPVKIVKVAWMLQDGCIFGNYTILFDARFQVCNSGVVHVFSGSPAKYKNSNVILLMTSILCGGASQNIPTTMYFGACNLIPHFHGLQFCSPALIVLLIGYEIWLPIPMTAQSTM